MRRTALKYGLAAAAAALMTVAHLALRGWGAGLPAAERWMLLCDAFTIPGVTLMLTAALVALSNEGSFDGLGYAVRYAVQRLVPGTGGPKETYAEFVERRREQGRIRGYGFLFYTGLAFFAAAMVFLVLFFRAEA